MKLKKKKEIDVMPTSDPWYDLFDGGYLYPKQFLANQDDIDRVNAAIETVREYMKLITDKEYIQIL